MSSKWVSAVVTILVALSVNTTSALQPDVIPVDFGWEYDGPTRVGPVTATADFFPPNQTCQSNDHAAEQIVRLGLHAVKMMVAVPYGSQEMLAVYRNPEIDVIVIRPMYDCQYRSYCGTSREACWIESADYGEVAEALYNLVGDEPKDIILTGWEQDWNLMRAFFQPDCDEPPCECPRAPTPQERADFKRFLENRQRLVSQVRMANLGAALRVYHAVEVSRIQNMDADSSAALDYAILDGGECRGSDCPPSGVLPGIVPYLSPKPDFISYSAYNALNGLGDHWMTERLEYIKNVSGIPASRIFIGEAGVEETHPGDQFQPLSQGLGEALGWGAKLGFMWHYREWWTHGGGMSLWENNAPFRFTGRLNSGYFALAAVRHNHECDGLCSDLPWDCGEGSGVWCQLPYECDRERICGHWVNYGQCAPGAACIDFQCICDGTDRKWATEHVAQVPHAVPLQDRACVNYDRCLLSSGNESRGPGELIDDGVWICGSEEVDGRPQGVWYQCEATRADCGVEIGGFTCTAISGGFQWRRLGQTHFPQYDD